MSRGRATTNRTFFAGEPVPRELKLTVFSPPYVTLLFTMLWLRAVYLERGTIAQMYYERDTFDFSQCHVTKDQPMEVPVWLSESVRI